MQFLTKIFDILETQNFLTTYLEHKRRKGRFSQWLRCTCAGKAHHTHRIFAYNYNNNNSPMNECTSWMSIESFSPFAIGVKGKLNMTTSCEMIIFYPLNYAIVNDDCK